MVKEANSFKELASSNLFVLKYDLGYGENGSGQLETDMVKSPRPKAELVTLMRIVSPASRNIGKFDSYLGSDIFEKLLSSK